MNSQFHGQAEKDPEQKVSHRLNDLMKPDRWRKNEGEQERPTRLITAEHHHRNSDLNRIQQERNSEQKIR